MGRLMNKVKSSYVYLYILCYPNQKNLYHFLLNKSYLSSPIKLKNLESPENLWKGGVMKETNPATY